MIHEQQKQVANVCGENKIFFSKICGNDNKWASKTLQKSIIIFQTEWW
jgi:hypothetical protein